MNDVVKAMSTVQGRETGSVVWMVMIENVMIPIRRSTDAYCCKRTGMMEKNVNRSHINKHDI